METTLVKPAVAVRPQRSIRGDRKAAMQSLVANLFGAIDGCKKLAGRRCPQSNRLVEAREHLERAKSLILQIAVLDTQHDRPD